MDDFLLAAAFEWITPLLTATSSDFEAETSSDAIALASPDAIASLKRRTAVLSDERTDLLRA